MSGRFNPAGAREVGEGTREAVDGAELIARGAVVEDEGHAPHDHRSHAPPTDREHRDQRPGTGARLGLRQRREGVTRVDDGVEE